MMGINLLILSFPGFWSKRSAFDSINFENDKEFGENNFFPQVGI